MFPSCEKVVVTDYPWRNHLSILLAVFFVYPALKKYMKVWGVYVCSCNTKFCAIVISKKNLNVSCVSQHFKVEAGPCIEYYEKDFIRFILPIDNREGFYVPEVSEQHR